MPPSPTRPFASRCLPVLAILLAILLALPCLAARPAPAQVRAEVKAADRKAIVEQQRRQMEAAYANLPELKQTRVQDVFTLRMENKSLAFHSPLSEGKAKAPEGQLKARLEGLEGLTFVQSSKFYIPGPRGNVEMRTFVLTHYDYSDPEVIATLSVQAQPNYFHIDKSSQLPDGFRSVRVMEQKPGPGQPGVITFNVTETTAAGLAPVSINVQEPDFYSLLRNHPRETDEHLRPLLRSLGQEQVFAPDPLIAWQIFADRWKPDQKTAAAVSKILPRLNAADYATRDAAVAALQKLGRPAVAVLLRTNRDRLTPEQNMRVDRVLSPYTQLGPDEVQRMRSDASFLLDCLYCEDGDVRLAAVQRLREVSGKPIEFDTKAATAKRWAAVAALRKQLFPAPGGRQPAKS